MSCYNNLSHSIVWKNDNITLYFTYHNTSKYFTIHITYAYINLGISFKNHFNLVVKCNSRVYEAKNYGDLKSKPKKNATDVDRVSNKIVV